MSNLVVNRILSQVNQVVPTPLLFVQPVPELSPPIALEELRQMFLKELTGPEIIKSDKPREAVFNGVFDFVDWYGAHELEFPEHQRPVLQGLVQLRDSIIMSCNCKRQIAENHGREAFQTFWVNNITTDIMPTLLSILNVDRILFGNFLVYP